jgi:hypothetical protein
MSPVPRLVHHAAAGDRGDDLCVINKRGRLPTMYRRHDQDLRWFVALGHIHTVRWRSVHLRDMISLTDSHPEVHSQFLTGNFSVKKTACNFSAIAIDQAHEQINASVKDDGDDVCLTENPAAPRRCMVSGPEMARVVGECDASSEKRKNTDIRHHEQTKHVQIAFARDVTASTGCDTVPSFGGRGQEDSVGYMDDI